MKKSLESGTNCKKIGCVIMASGLSLRFGSNKLLAEFAGMTLIDHALCLTDGELFAKRVVVTRSCEVETICKERGVEVIFHELPGRNDTVRLGVEQMQEMDGCVFCPCDQPLLTKESLRELKAAFFEGKETICRLAYGEREGAPVLFDRMYFEQLCCLPQKKGGGYLIKKYPEQVRLVQARMECELYDIDTPKDLEYLESVKKKYL